MLSPTAKYLASFAEPESRREISGAWDHVIAVPAIGEAETFPRLWESAVRAATHAQVRVALIVVVNGKESTPPEAKLSNEALWKALPRLESECVTIVAVDRFSPGRELGPKQGVGQARKIGCDLALALIAAGKVQSADIEITDADASLPEDFFVNAKDTARTPFAGLNVDRPVVGLHDFVHRPEPGYERHIAEYDAFLHYYERGLAQAGSPYAFQTVGSTLRVSAAAYAEVRGFPDKAAGEDFYLLNKLAKVGGVYATGKTITLSGRPSWRVPFGTGASVNKIDQEFSQGKPYEIYDPKVFESVTSWLGALNAWAEVPDDLAFRQRVGDLWPIGEMLGAPHALQSARTSRRDAASRRRHLHEWFDAFRTLRFVHEVTNAQLPRQAFAAVLTAT